VGKTESPGWSDGARTPNHGSWFWFETSLSLDEAPHQDQKLSSLSANHEEWSQLVKAKFPGLFRKILQSQMVTSSMNNYQAKESLICVIVSIV
jgi:hypothetical protein